MKDLSITLVQCDLRWEDPAANLEHIINLVRDVTATDLIVLPEMFTTGFSMRPAGFAESSDGEAIRWMRGLARSRNAVVCGSIMFREDGRYYNRLTWMRPDGTFSAYDKRHLFSMGNEHEHYAAGTSRIIEELAGWKIMPLICYDLRFPVWSRRTVSADYDLLLYVANWPERRSFAWKSLLVARAIENQCYVCGVNRVGADGAGVAHSGDSVLLDPLGQSLAALKAGAEVVHSQSLSAEVLRKLRADFPLLRDADAFRLLP